jgi:hypothetical protein
MWPPSLQMMARIGTLFHLEHPHFGGLWEAAVKSVKKHLTLTLTETALSFEEFNTILCQVEACVNSRPINALTSDPEDLEALTPGHFLTGRPLTAPPQRPIEGHPYKRWTLLKKLQQDLWKRWSQEYLSNLQSRSKWNQEKPNAAVGDLVLIKEDNLPPLKWVLGNILEVSIGSDSKIRGVALKTKRGHGKKRPIAAHRARQYSSTQPQTSAKGKRELIFTC